MANIDFANRSYLCPEIQFAMPVSKDAMARYRIIDRLLADPNKDYTTEQILYYVNLECPHVTLRMIQKDISSLSDPNGQFRKPLVRNAGGRGTVRYEDQSTPLFYQELTLDEEEVLREVLRSLGQFEGLDNFTWLDLLKKKLNLREGEQYPIISFSRNDGLQIPATLLGRLFTAISKKKVVRLTYTVFGREPKQYTVYPYQLKQYNDRWYLLCTPLSDGVLPYNPSLVINLPLDRIAAEFDYVEGEPYVETPVDLKARFEEIIGVTLMQDAELEDIYFAVSPGTVPYVRTKYLHMTQMELDADFQAEFRKKYPALSEWTFFTIECRPNRELYDRFSSFGRDVVLVEPAPMREHMRRLLEAASANYASVGE